MSTLTIDNIEVFACKTDAPKITWAKDMTPMYEANVIVKLTTKDGYEGFGGVLVPTEHSYDHSLPEAMKNLFPEVLNCSIHDREKLTGHMLTRCIGLNPNAVSCIDIAMWDCYAKYLKLPLYKVLGAKRESIQSYASTPLFNTIPDYIDFVKNLSARGFRTIKFHTWCDLDFDSEMVQAVCKAIPDMQYMIDCEQRYEREDALKLGKILDKFNFIWFEAPFIDTDLESYKWLRRQIHTPVISAGNSILDFHLIKKTIEDKVFDHLRFDTTYIGGITIAKKIMEMACINKLNVELQSWAFPLGQAANLHMMLSNDNCEYFEQVVPFEDHEHGANNYIRTDYQGIVYPTSKNGLGIELNWDQINKDCYLYIKLDKKGLRREINQL
ncbi:mandelate racemase/muconate lactonizing enzyme family protein [Alphaproteobacteria bacterium]|nr:mandelate racemase/muconate lactonizing enzyme family protein [Alphaproteobacteria bacterium]